MRGISTAGISGRKRTATWLKCIFISPSKCSHSPTPTPTSNETLNVPQLYLPSTAEGSINVHHFVLPVPPPPLGTAVKNILLPCSCAHRAVSPPGSKYAFLPRTRKIYLCNIQSHHTVSALFTACVEREFINPCKLRNLRI